MEIIGNGFIARNFECMRASYPDTLLFAGGVSRWSSSDEAELYREVEILYDTIRCCRERGYLLIYFSTSSNMMYCDPSNRGLEDGPVFPRLAYARHKLAMETVIRFSGVDYLILRLASPVGRHQKPYQLLPALYNQVQSGTVSIHRGAKRYLIDIGDVIDITCLLLSRNVRCQVLNVASSYSVSIEDIVDHLLTKISAPVCKKYIDNPIANSETYWVSLAKLDRYVGGLEPFKFDQDYYKRVIDKYY